MRPVIQKVGTCTTAVPVMTGVNRRANNTTIDTYDCSQIREKAVQLVNADGNWVAGTVAFEASLDGGVTWGVFDTKAGPGFYVVPVAVLGLFRAVASGLPATTSIDVWVSGLDARTE